MTYKNSKIKFIVFFIIMITLLIIMLSFFVKSKINNKNNKYFLEKNIYLIYSIKDSVKSNVKISQELIKNLGGGGEIIFYDNYYYLTVSIYLNKIDAENVVNNIDDYFPKTGILELKINKISNKLRNKISNNIKILEFFKFMNTFTDKIYENQINFLSGKITNRELLNFLIERKLDLEKYINIFENSNENFKQNILQYCNLNLLYINNFYNNYFDSKKENSLICELAINVIISQFDFVNNL